MAANTSGFSNAQPSGLSSIRLGDDLIRADKVVLEAVLNDEHYFTPQTSASSLSGGVHKAGSARIFSGLRASLSTPASADSSGRLYYATDTESLHFYGASSTSTINWGRAVPGAIGVSATTNVASGTSVPAVLSAELYDVGGFFTAGGSRMTVPSGFSGLYLLTGHAQFPSLHTGTRRSIALVAGGLTVPVHATNSIGTHNGAGDISLSVSHVRQLADGDSVSLLVYQDSGGNISATTVQLSVSRL